MTWHGPFGIWGWTHDEDPGRRYLLHRRVFVHGIPRAFTCRVFGHLPVVDGYGEPGQQYPGGRSRCARWVACGRCDTRPSWQGELPPALYPTLGARYDGPWSDPDDIERARLADEAARERWYVAPIGDRGPLPPATVLPAWPSQAWGPDSHEGTGPRGNVSLTLIAWDRKWRDWPGIGFEVSLGAGETPIDAHLHLAKLGAVYLGLERYGAALAHRLYGRNMPETRRWGVELSGLDRQWSFRWQIAAREDRRNGRRRYSWREGYVNLAQSLFGEATSDTHVIAEADVVIPLPEGGYPAHVTLERCLWRRERGRVRTTWRADVKPIVGIPEPGKGENSWDCGDDATYEMSTPVSGPDGEWLSEAVGAMVNSVMRQRERYGSGQSWTPDAGWPEQLIPAGQ